MLAYECYGGLSGVYVEISGMSCLCTSFVMGLG